MNLLRIATRGSKLALWQAEHVRALLLSGDPSLEVSLVVLKTQGDKILDRPLAEIGGKGLFTKEIEEALLDGRADIAVHSMKDMPAGIPDGLTLAAVPLRADPSDALLLGPAHAHLKPATSATALLRALPAGARIGTSSLRRVSQLLKLRADIEIVPLRGNVDTRLRKLDVGEFDAMVLASAGLLRLGFQDRIDARFSPEEMISACGQGALGLECRRDDAKAKAHLLRLADAKTTRAVTAERAFSERLGGSCKTPLGAYAVVQKDGVSLRGMVGSLDGKTILCDSLSGADEKMVGRELAERLLAAGAAALIAKAAS